MAIEGWQYILESFINKRIRYAIETKALYSSGRRNNQILSRGLRCKTKKSIAMNLPIYISSFISIHIKWLKSRVCMKICTVWWCAKPFRCPFIFVNRVQGRRLPHLNLFIPKTFSSVRITHSNFGALGIIYAIICMTISLCATFPATTNYIPQSCISFVDNIVVLVAYKSPLVGCL